MWTYGESNPDLVHAMDAFYRYTIGPMLPLRFCTGHPIKICRN